MIRDLLPLTLCGLILGAASAHADVVISTGTTSNMKCSAGVCEPIATDAVLNVSDLENMLSSGNVTVTTTGRYEAYNIDVEAGFSWSTANALSLDAADHITIDDEVFSSGSGNLSLSLGSGVPFLIGRHGRVVFQNTSSQLSIDGSEYTLVNSISSLASAIASNPSGNFALSDNYDASADGTYSDSPITTIFTGNFDGLGNTISHLSIHHTGNRTWIGLFSFLFTPGTLEHVRLAHVRIKGTNRGDIIGALAGVTTGGYLFQDSATGTIQLSGAGVVGDWWVRKVRLPLISIPALQRSQ